MTDLFCTKEKVDQSFLPSVYIFAQKLHLRHCLPGSPSRAGAPPETRLLDPLHRQRVSTSCWQQNLGLPRGAQHCTGQSGGRVKGKNPVLWAFFNWDSTYTWQNLIRNKNMHTFRSQITGRNDPSRSGEGKSIVERGLWGKGLGEVRSNGPGRGRRREFSDSPSH